MKIHELAIQAAIKNLTATGCLYSIIKSDGTVFSNIEPPKRKRRNFEFPVGYLSSIYKPVIDGLAPGEMGTITEIPEGVDIERFRAACCAYISTNYKGKIITSVENGQIYFLRNDQ